MALIDCNLPNKPGGPGKELELWGSDSADFTVNYERWDISGGVTDNGVMRYYLDTPTATNGTFTAKTHRYWNMTFNPSSFGVLGLTELRIGAWFLGTYIPFVVSSGAGITVVDPTLYAASYNGTSYTDPLPCYSRVKVNVDFLARDGLYSLKKSLSEIGSALTVLDLHGYAASLSGYVSAIPAAADRASSYYGRMAGGTNSELRLTSLTDNGATIAFTEEPT